MKTHTKLLTGLAVGWVTYMGGLAVYDGALSMIGQPIVAAVFSGVFVLLSWLLGFSLRIPFIWRFWGFLGTRVIIISIVAFVMIIFARPLGLTQEFSDPNTGDTIRAMNPYISSIAYFLSIFPIVNLRSIKQETEPAH